MLHIHNSRVSGTVTLAFILSGHCRDCGSQVITCRLIARTWNLAESIRITKRPKHTNAKMFIKKKKKMPAKKSGDDISQVFGHSFIYYGPKESGA